MRDICKMRNVHVVTAYEFVQIYKELFVFLRACQHN
jgi:hypothetical protein